MSETPSREIFDFEKCTLRELQDVELKFTHKMNRTGILNGYALYFDAMFHSDKENQYRVLKTGPEAPATHWY